jgi:hypothetical protein
MAVFFQVRQGTGVPVRREVHVCGERLARQFGPGLPGGKVPEVTGAGSLAASLAVAAWSFVVVLLRGCICSSWKCAGSCNWVVQLWSFFPTAHRIGVGLTLCWSVVMAVL